MATGTAIGQKGNWRGRYSLSQTNGTTSTTVICYFYVEHVSGAGKLARYHYRGTFDNTNGSTYYPSKSSLGCDGNGKGETVGIGSVTKTYAQTHEAQTLSKVVKVTNTDTGSAVSKTISITIPPKTNYAVTYYPNGGTGSITDTKWHDEDLTLSDGTGITRDHYTLVGWNTAADGSGTHYDLEEVYTGNVALDLYAEWELNAVLIKTKIDGEWLEGVVHIKHNSEWIIPHAGYVKIDGEWLPII